MQPLRADFLTIPTGPIRVFLLRVGLRHYVRECSRHPADPVASVVAPVLIDIRIPAYLCKISLGNVNYSKQAIHS
ncbi:hypothetical protein IF1G_08839 [Cordyceps javanica]|uniref:Uncharacterized protein n=1 Tax=Cordyceps javanica TaxID=43265 RepID=A0A545US94_9HYPO|nr:hypothetical protein IF1G_08839 [Cordyceps javanica]